MQLSSLVPKKKTVFVEIMILAVFLGGMYYVYTQFSSPAITTVQSATVQPFMGANSTLLLNAIHQDKIDFKSVSFMDSDLVQELQDFSETISTSTYRGRLDPFTPYASSRPIR